MSDSAPNHDPSTNPAGDTAADAELDRLLADAAGLAADLGREFGTDPPAEPTGDASAGDVDASLERVDQLLAETAEDLGNQTDPQLPANEPPPGEAATPTQDQADPASTPAEPIPAPDYLADDSPPEPQEEQPESETPPTPKPKPSRIKPIAIRTARRSAAFLIGCLDVIDRPFTAIGYQVRIIVGWVAVVTLLAAICVMVISR